MGSRSIRRLGMHLATGTWACLRLPLSLLFALVVPLAVVWWEIAYIQPASPASPAHALPSTAWLFSDPPAVDTTGLSRSDQEAAQKEAVAELKLWRTHRQATFTLLWILVCLAFIPAQWFYRILRLGTYGSVGTVHIGTARQTYHLIRDRTSRAMPLFAVAALIPQISPTKGIQRSESAVRTVLIPFGIARPVIAMAVAVGGLVSIAFCGQAPIGLWPLGGVTLITISLFILLALAPSALVALGPGAMPLDGYFANIARTELGTVVEGVGLIPARDSYVGRTFPWLFAVTDSWRIKRSELAAFVAGLTFGFAINPLRPNRLRSLIELPSLGQQRELLCYALERVLTGGQNQANRQLPLSVNVSFLALYFGHALSIFGGLVVSLVTIIASEHLDALPSDANPCGVMVFALLMWWSLLVIYAFHTCARDVEMMTKDLASLSPDMPRSLQRQRKSEPLLLLFEMASTRWIPAAASVGSGILVVLVLTAIQALGSVP